MTDREQRDELFDALASAWRNQPVPQPGGDLAAEDAVTRDTVRWLANAWAAQPVPPVRLPARITNRHARTAWRLSWRPLAAAALLILILTVPLMQRERGGSGDRTGDRNTPPPVVAVNPSAPPAPTVTADGLLLRSGPVRLLLLSQTTTTPFEDAR